MPVPVFILLIDIDPLLVEMLEEIAADTWPDVRFRQVGTAGEATDYIGSASIPQPDVIWLNINLLDRHNELEFLAGLRASPITRSLPVRLLADGILTCDVVDSYTFENTSFSLRPYSRSDWKAWLDNQMIATTGS